jgi:hypothetical protein
MSTKSVSIALVFSIVSVAACAAEDDSSSGSTGAPAASTTAATTGGLGKACTTYYGTCCPEIANSLPAGTNRDMAVKACTDAKAGIDKGVTGGASASQYESACQQSIDAAKSAGKCK